MGAKESTKVSKRGNFEVRVDSESSVFLRLGQLLKFAGASGRVFGVKLLNFL